LGVSFHCEFSYQVDIQYEFVLNTNVVPHLLLIKPFSVITFAFDVFQDEHKAKRWS